MSIISDQLIVSGNHADALLLLKEKEQSPAEFAQACYLLGNQFYQAGKKMAASRAWESAAEAYAQPSVDTSETQSIPENTLKYRWQTIGSVILVIVCLYITIFSLFQRPPEPFNLSMFGNQQQPSSAWDEWWDSQRPVKQQLDQKYEVQDLWPMLSNAFENLISDDESQLSDSVREKLKKWLEQAQQPNLSKGPPDFYAITGRGLFDVREFEDAISTYQDGLHFARKPYQFEQLFQELGTVYYYKGYHLQPNGLALYDLEDVKNSVQSYEKALKFGADPYLYGNLGWGYYLLKDYSKAIQYSLRAIETRPRLNYARMNLGITYLRMGEFSLSYQAYESLMKYAPDLDEYEGGIRDLFELQREFPGRFPFIDFVLGHLYWQQGRYHEAQNAFQNFLNQHFPHQKWKNKARRYLAEMKRE